MNKTQIKTDTKNDKKAIIELSEKELAQVAGGKKDRRVILY
jgi:bacteriocin-like protein